jgi:hypothetical protein
METQTVAPTRLPTVLLSIGLQERLLIVLNSRPPQPMKTLCDQLGASSIAIWRVLNRMRRERLVRRFGVRASSQWALATWRGRVPKRAQKERRKKSRTAHVDRGSWWLVEDARFAEEARARAAAMGWDK